MGIWAEEFQVCLFDMRRGQEEGHELDKILFFSPSDWPLPSQLSVVGLSEGLITFTKIFSPDAPCEVMEAERRCHIFHQCEPEIWMVMVVKKNKDAHEPTRDGAVRALLKEAHVMFTMFFGPIRALLDKHPAGDVARCSLFSFLPDYFADFMVGKKLRLPSSADSLTERGMVERLPLLPEALHESQALVGMMQSWSDSEYVVHVLIISQNQLVASTLLPGDTSALFTYASLRMRPDAVTYATSMRASYRRSNSSQLLDRQSNEAQPQNKGTNNSSADHNSEGMNSLPRSTSSMGDNRGIPKPLQRDAWYRGQDNFLSTYVWGLDTAEGRPALPTIWLQDSRERMCLSAYQHKSLTLLLIIPAQSSSDVAHLKKQLVEKASAKIQRLEGRLAKDWGGPNASHIPSYRYLYLNLNLKTAQSSPAGKVTTLAKDTLIALSRVRAEVDLERSRLARKDSTHELEFELSMRTKNNAWVVARTRSGHELYTALEKSGDTLLSASEAIEKLSARYFDERFTSG